MLSLFCLTKHKYGCVSLQNRRVSLGASPPKRSGVRNAQAESVGSGKVAAPGKMASAGSTEAVVDDHERALALADAGDSTHHLVGLVVAAKTTSGSPDAGG